MRMIRPAAVLLSALGLAATAACTSTVDGSDIESKVVDTAKQQGVTAKDVSCEDLTAEKGEKSTCTLTVQGKKYKLVAEVRGVDGNKVNYYINAPTPAS